MHEFLNALAQPLPLMIPGEPFAVSPYPWRSAYDIPVALIGNQLWIVGPDAPKNLPALARRGTLDLHECAMEPESILEVDRFFLLPVLHMSGLPDSWTDSLKAAIAANGEGWMFLVPDETEPRFESHYGFPRPRSVHWWSEDYDFNAVVEQAFSGRILTAGHAKRSAQLRSIIKACCPPQKRVADMPCPRCHELWCERCPLVPSLHSKA